MGPRAHGNTASPGGAGSNNRETPPAATSTSPRAPTTGLRSLGNDTTWNTGRGGRQNALTRCSTRREQQVTVQGPGKDLQPNGMSHWGGRHVRQSVISVTVQRGGGLAQGLGGWLCWPVAAPIGLSPLNLLP